VLLSADPNSPTAAEIVEGYDFASGLPPPLAGLAVESPVAVEYLIPQRATGKFAEYLAARPDSVRARLERYVVVSYGTQANLNNARNALLADSNVDHAHAPPSVEFNVSSNGAPMPASQKAVWQDWRSSVGVPAAWQLAGGWALVGIVDNGIATTHPDLTSFANGSYLAGNFLPALSFDAGWSGGSGCQQAGNCIEPDVDEVQPFQVIPGSTCDADGDGWAAVDLAGHGSHVAGLVGANASNGDSTRGACRYCGLMAWRITRDLCPQIGIVRPSINIVAINAAITLQTDLGVQVINQSLGRSTAVPPDHCQQHPLNSECLALAHAAQRGVVLIGAAGNDRKPIAFPANHPAVVSTGGLGQDLQAWDLDTDPPPNHLDDCPQPPAVANVGDECGSNFTIDIGVDRRQETTAPAAAIVSTSYPGFNWHNGLACGDSFDGLDGDGVGPCTGTSMASPIVAGITGLLRSINPLVMPGDPENQADALGIRDVLASTSAEAQIGSPWNAHLGYGRPDAAAAARRMLGTVRGVTARNRAIPLFDFNSAAATDYAVTASPQIAMTLAITQPWVWAARGPAVAGYPSFPIAPNAAMPAPHASAYVLSTEYRTDDKQPPLVPLYLLSRARPWPIGCIPGTFQCNHANRDFMLVSTVAALEFAVADGYDFFGRQGYVFQRCAPEPVCIPDAASKLYRLCNAAEDDCAIFLEHELAAFQSLGYTAAYPAGSDPVMGYAYANVDTDGDALIDGFERLIGTNAASIDSDGDGSSDGIEYPLAGIPVSDPCAGPAITCTQSRVFDDGFE
jgi:serine protease